MTIFKSSFLIALVEMQTMNKDLFSLGISVIYYDELEKKQLIFKQDIELCDLFLIIWCCIIMQKMLQHVFIKASQQRIPCLLLAIWCFQKDWKDKTLVQKRCFLIIVFLYSFCIVSKTKKRRIKYQIWGKFERITCLNVRIINEKALMFNQLTFWNPTFNTDR